jgi:hypothetical protein
MTVADLDNMGVDNSDDLWHPIQRLACDVCPLCGVKLDKVFVYLATLDPLTKQHGLGFHPKCAQHVGQLFIKDGIIGDMIQRRHDPGVIGVVPSLRRDEPEDEDNEHGSMTIYFGAPLAVIDFPDRDR